MASRPPQASATRRTGVAPSDRDLAQRWDDHAEAWIAWARKPGHDSFWRFHRDAFLKLLPAPGKLTVDVGCGEGRLPRELKKIGHEVIGVEPSETLYEAACEADPRGRYVHARGESVPLDSACADLVTAFMVLHDVDDLDKVVSECARLMTPQGKLCIAIVHPINSAGDFADDGADSAFVMSGDYLDDHATQGTFARGGLTMTFHSRHRSIEHYSLALEAAGLRIEALREPPALEGDGDEMSAVARRWLRIPLFLHLRCVKA